MKWRSFQKLLENNPDIAGSILREIGPPVIISASLNHSPEVAERILRNYVESTVDFVAFRSFNSLDLDNSGNSVINRQEQVVGVDPARAGWERYCVYEDYRVWFQIVGEEKPGNRVVHLDSHNSYQISTEPCYYTIRQVIDSRVAWHQLYWAKQGNALRFNAVTKGTVVWKITDFQDTRLSEHLEIYRFPPSYKFAGDATQTA